MQVPESSCLLSQSAAAEPGKLVIACIVKATHAIGNRVSQLFFRYKLFHGGTIHKKIAVGV